MDWDAIKRLLEENNTKALVDFTKGLSFEAAQNFETLLISELQTTGDCNYRNTIAVVLGELHSNQAIGSLIKLINKTENSKCNATLIYALQGLDCEMVIPDILLILDSDNYEAQWMLCNLLKEKWDKMSLDIQNKITQYIQTKFNQHLDSLELLEDLKLTLGIEDE